MQTTLEEISSALGFQLFKVYGREVQSKESLLRALANAMSFPSYFGQNWDALLDCMRDLSWCRSDGYLLLFEDVNNLLECCPTDLNSFLEIVDNVVSVWRADSTPFHVIFTGTRELPSALAGIVLQGVCDHTSV